MNGSTRAHRRSHPNGRGFREAYRAGQGEAAPDMRANVVSVPMSELRAADSPRLNGVDANHVRTLAEVEEPLPPICVHHASMRIIDGMHRVGAARLNGREDIEVVFFDGSDEEAFRLAVKANISHGLPLSLAERQAAAGRILRSHPLQSDRSIGATTGLAAKTVAAIRRRISDAPASARIGRDGRVRPLSTAEGRRIASKAIEARPDASLRTIARLSGVSVGTVRDVRARIQAGQDPVPGAQHADATPPAAAPVNSARRVQSVADPVDIDSLLDGLCHDPSLRYRDSGRTFLQWLRSGIAQLARWRRISHELPPHCGVVVAKIARECSRIWLEMADEMDRMTG